MTSLYLHDVIVAIKLRSIELQFMHEFMQCIQNAKKRLLISLQQFFFTPFLYDE